MEGSRKLLAQHDDRTRRLGAQALDVFPPTPFARGASTGTMPTVRPDLTAQSVLQPALVTRVAAFGRPAWTHQHLVKMGRRAATRAASALPLARTRRVKWRTVGSRIPGAAARGMLSQ